MELPNEIWNEIIQQSKKTPKEMINEINDPNVLENLKKLIDRKLIVSYYDIAKKYNKFDILFDEINYWIIVEKPVEKLCKIRKALRTEVSGVFGKFNIVEENETNIVSAILDTSNNEIHMSDYYTITKLNFNRQIDCEIRKFKIVQSIKDLEKIRASYANTLKAECPFRYNYVSTADYRQASYFNDPLCAIRNIRTARVYYTTDKYIYINQRERIDKRFVIEEL